MAEQSIAKDSPGSALFPEYETLYDLIASEVQGLSDEELDFVSDRWEWSTWSIRTQLSHMASLIYRWLLIRWGDTLFPDGGHGVRDTQGLAQSDLMIKAHSTGFTVTREPDKEIMTLEASMRHIYFEEITHLYNIQRLKRAQALPGVVDLPRVGYWVVDGWDRSEP